MNRLFSRIPYLQPPLIIAIVWGVHVNADEGMRICMIMDAALYGFD